MFEEIKKPAVIVITAEWCKFCDKLKKFIKDNLTNKFNNINFKFVNIQNKPKIKDKFLIRGIPFIIFYESDGSFFTRTGKLRNDKLESLIKSINKE